MLLGPKKFLKMVATMKNITALNAGYVKNGFWEIVNKS